MTLLDLARSLAHADYEDRAAMRTLVAHAIDTLRTVEREQISMRHATALRGAARACLIATLRDAVTPADAGH